MFLKNAAPLPCVWAPTASASFANTQGLTFRKNGTGPKVNCSVQFEVGFYLEEGLDIAERRIVVVAPGFAHPIVGKRPVQLHGDIHREQQRAMVAKELSVPWIGARTGAHALVLTPLPLHLVEVAVCLLGARLRGDFFQYSGSRSPESFL